MQIVIKLSDKTYKDIKEENGIYGTDYGLSIKITGKVVGAIQSGTPLSNHGRLIDAGELVDVLNDAQIEGSNTYKGLGRAKELLVEAPTVIDAGSEDKK